MTGEAVQVNTGDPTDRIYRIDQGDGTALFIGHRVTVDGIRSQRGAELLGTSGTGEVYVRPMISLHRDNDRAKPYVYRHGPPIDEDEWLANGRVYSINEAF